MVWESHEQARAGADDAEGGVARARLWAGIQADVWTDRRDDGDWEEFPRVVRRGEEAEMVAAFAQAQQNATALWRLLCRLGLGTEVISLAATLSGDNQPVTRLRMTPRGACLLHQLIVGEPARPAHDVAG